MSVFAKKSHEATAKRFQPCLRTDIHCETKASMVDTSMKASHGGCWRRAGVGGKLLKLSSFSLAGKQLKFPTTGTQIAVISQNSLFYPQRRVLPQFEDDTRLHPRDLPPTPGERKEKGRVEKAPELNHRVLGPSTVPWSDQEEEAEQFQHYTLLEEKSISG